MPNHRSVCVSVLAASIFTNTFVLFCLFLVATLLAMQCYRSYITPVDKDLIPTGSFEPVAGTPYDLNKPTLLRDTVHKVNALLITHCKPTHFTTFLSAVPIPFSVAKGKPACLLMLLLSLHVCLCSPYNVQYYGNSAFIFTTCILCGPVVFRSTLSGTMPKLLMQRRMTRRPQV